MERFEFRPYQPGDEELINRGFNEVFGLERSADEWRWKFQAEPEGRWIVVAVDADGALVAQYAVVPVRFQVDGLRLRAGQPVDAFCLRRPGLVQRGLFTQTVHEFYRSFGAPDKIAFIFGFPGERHMRLGKIRLLYVDPVPVPLWRRSDPVRRLVWTGHRVRRGFDREAVERLWERASSRYPVAAIRDGAWLARRYQGRPGGDYIHLSAWRGGEPRAWTVVRRGADAVLWAELVWDGDDPRALEALDRQVARLARESRVADCEMWLAGDPPAEETFARLGWRRQEHPEHLQLTAVSFHPGVDGVRLIRRLYLTMGDSDLV
jgi:hypothetical protein